MEVSKVRQLTALQAFGIDVPRTIAVVGKRDLLERAATFTGPFITKHNQGGKGQNNNNKGGNNAQSGKPGQQQPGRPPFGGFPFKVRRDEGKNRL